MDIRTLRNKLNRKKQDPIPKGYKSCSQLAKKWGMSESNTYGVLRDSIASGLLHQVTLRRLSGSRLFKVQYYGTKKVKEPAKQPKQSKQRCRAARAR